jgi:hypothetical protein
MEGNVWKVTQSTFFVGVLILKKPSVESPRMEGRRVLPEETEREGM